MSKELLFLPLCAPVVRPFFFSDEFERKAGVLVFDSLT